MKIKLTAGVVEKISQKKAPFLLDISQTRQYSGTRSIQYREDLLHVTSLSTPQQYFIAQETCVQEQEPVIIKMTGRPGQTRPLT